MAEMCRVPDCDRAITYKRTRLCQTHQRDHRAGVPFRKIKLHVAPGDPCLFPPCVEPGRNLGYCKTHYDQHRRGRPMRAVKPYVPTTKRDEQGNKWCGTCETWKPEVAFASSKGKPDGLQTRCRECNSAIYRARADIIRDKMRKQRFNLSRAEFDAMFAVQGEACAICGTTEPGSTYWCVDHDHRCCPMAGISCGKCIRGILCARCNHGIGHMRDNPMILESAAAYLRATSGSSSNTQAL